MDTTNFIRFNPTHADTPTSFLRWFCMESFRLANTMAEDTIGIAIIQSLNMKEIWELTYSRYAT